MFIKNDWYLAAWSSEVTDTPFARQLVGESIVLFRDAEGKVAALRDQCCHRGAALSPGRIVAQGIECPYHGMVFDAKGRCVHIPTQSHIPSKACVRHFELEERDGMIWLWAGDPAAADRSKIIDYPYHGDRKWPYLTGHLHAKCGYEMLVENIMDLTHVVFVHRKTIGGGDPKAHGEALMTTERTARGVKFVRWLLNSVPPPIYLQFAALQGAIDRWQEETLFVPGTIIQYTGGVDTAQHAYDGGSREGGFAWRFLHVIVPETETTCHYFYSSANGCPNNDAAATQALFAGATVTLKEDLEILETQQARTSQYPQTAFVDLRSDQARVLYRRHLADRLSEEARSSVATDPASRPPAVAASLT